MLDIQVAVAKNAGVSNEANRVYVINNRNKVYSSCTNDDSLR